MGTTGYRPRGRVGMGRDPAGALAGARNVRYREVGIRYLLESPPKPLFATLF
jgi:hypothetical protein